MRLRNNIFAAAFDELKRNHGIRTQKELARRMGVSEDTITRILRDYTDVTEDIITKLQTASGCIFNLQWLRGEDNEPMLAKDCTAGAGPSPAEHVDPSSLVNAMLAAKDETIVAKDEIISSLKSQIVAMQKELAAKDESIALLRQRLSLFHSQERSSYPSLVADNRALEDTK